MKYQRLSKEQFDELHQEFGKFLATQSIDAKEWKKYIKESSPIVDQELDIFSDLVWEDALKKVRYIERISKTQMFLFHFPTDIMKMISIQVDNTDIDLTTKEGLQWLEESLHKDQVVIYQGQKKYSDDPLLDKFEMVKQGGEITEGLFYKAIKEKL